MRYFKTHPKCYIDHVYRAKDPIAYCWCDTHKGYLSVKLMKNHECLKKQCAFLEKYEEHPYWIQEKIKKEEKKRRKLERKIQQQGAL